MVIASAVHTTASAPHLIATAFGATASAFQVDETITGTQKDDAMAQKADAAT